MTKEEAKAWFKVLLKDEYAFNSADREAFALAIKALEQEPTDDATLKDIFCMGCEYKEQEPCEDAISRQAVDKAIYDYSRSCDVNYAQIMEYIDKIPPVNPQTKTGHWIEQEDFNGDTYYDCSECGESFCLIEGTPIDNLYQYCPNCGAKMEGKG